MQCGQWFLLQCWSSTCCAVFQLLLKSRYSWIVNKPIHKQRLVCLYLSMSFIQVQRTVWVKLIHSGKPFFNQKVICGRSQFIQWAIEDHCTLMQIFGHYQIINEILPNRWRPVVLAARNASVCYSEMVRLALQPIVSMCAVQLCQSC